MLRPAFAASADFAFDKPAGVACGTSARTSAAVSTTGCGRRACPAAWPTTASAPGSMSSQVTLAGARLARVAAYGGAHVRRLRRDAAAPRAGLVPDRGAGDGDRSPAASRRSGRRSTGSRRSRGCRPRSCSPRTWRVVARRSAPCSAKASELAREGVEGGPRRRERDRRGADLAGADLRGQDLRGANLRGALLIGADLRASDLRLADLAGADLRGADLRGADLRGALFVTQSQLETATGDPATLLSPARARAGPLAR